ncbi:hypothetical protein N8218_00990 [bacterium]|nr:hypothetical protein [bacterium]
MAAALRLAFLAKASMNTRVIILLDSQYSFAIIGWSDKPKNMTYKSTLVISCLILLFPVSWGQNEEPTVVSPGSNEAADIEDGVPSPEVSSLGNSEEKQHEASGGAEQQETSGEEESESNSSDFLVTIVVLSFFSGALLVWTFFLRRQGSRLKALKEKVLDGGEKIPLLNEEALELIKSFKSELEASRSELIKEFKEHQASMGLQLKEAQNFVSEAQALTKETIAHFKENLQKSFGQIQTYMQKIADSSAGSYTQAKETAEYAKQVGETVIEKDREITKLREGYQLSMIGPLIKGILELRDKLIALEGLSDIDEATKKELNELNQLVVSALKDVGVNEIDIQHGTDPTEFPLHKWDALEVPESTSEESLSKKVAEVVKLGYVALGPDASDVVVRKAKVIRYKYSESGGERN